MAWHPASADKGAFGPIRICYKGIATLITGPGGSAKRASNAAAARQAEVLKQQEALQARARLKEDERETELSGQLAGQRRAIAARRRGGQLAYTGPNTGLKSTFGG